MIGKNTNDLYLMCFLSNNYNTDLPTIIVNYGGKLLDESGNIYDAASGTKTGSVSGLANANTRAILDAINGNKIEALKDRIAEQNQMINSLQLTASQVAQNQYLVEKLNPNPCPQPAYVVQPPQTISFPNTCGVANYNNGCGCNA